VSIRNFLAALTSAALILPASPPAQADVAGPYLAGRHASVQNDFRAEAQYYARAIVAAPRNTALMESAILAYLSLGDIDRAAAVARRLFSLGAESQVANMAALAEGFWRENYDGLTEDLNAGISVGPLVDGLLAAWAAFGEGRVSDALASFDAVTETAGVEIFGLYHKALALALAGDFEGAAEILSGDAEGPLQLTRRGVLAYVQILSQLERNADAVELIDASFGTVLDEDVSRLRAALEAGDTVPFRAVTGPRDGAAEVFLVVAGALNGEANDRYTLLYARIAEYLRPGDSGAILLSAALLEELERYELATEVYSQIEADDPAFGAAELGRADALRRADRTEEAIEVLRNLTRLDPGNPEVHMTLGDALRRLERYDEASRAYDDAIALFETDVAAQWLAYFARGITHEREDRWALAETDFRKALELNPGQPQVLNYLGYSFVEMGINLDEALGMIEEAVEAQPDSGYIVDSLGWVQYRLGQYEKAVVNLEKATELMPVDPIINDHLGDAYWAVGRKIEAEFQWHRALSFEPEEKDADRIRRKLEVGLDAVLEEEGADPLTKVATDG
jgi:tetratricopeptide (TPR) repeat protein